MHATADLSMTLGESDLHRLEQALLDAILDEREDRGNAVDRLLSESNFAGDRAHVEQLLAAAVMDNHPNRNQALDRLLGDLGQPAPFAAHA